MNRLRRARMTPRPLLALLALAPFVLGASARPEPPVRENRIFLSARAPFGAPGALTTLAPACGDTTRRDTLYLCFEPAKDESTMIGFSAEVHVYAQPGDTLGSFWAMERGGANNGGMVVTFGPDETFPQPQPWPVQGVGSALYDRTPASARFRFLYAMPLGKAGPVQAGRRYVLGRILLGSKHAGLEGCERPVCIEWHTATVQYRAGEKLIVNHTGSRWLPRGANEESCRGRIPAWRPRR